MLVRARQIAILFAAALLASALSGCGTVNEKMSAGMADFIPQWAGGLPADAPPRPGTEKYDEYMRERERLRQMPASERPGAQQQTTQQQPSQPPQDAQARAAPSGLDPVH
jgi:hypothetical protein